MDLLIEIIFEIFVEGYVAITMALVPEKNFSPKAYLAIKILCAIISCLCLFALFIGFGCMLAGGPKEKLFGKYIFFIALAVTIIQIAIGVIGKIKSK